MTGRKIYKGGRVSGVARGQTWEGCRGVPFTSMTGNVWSRPKGGEDWRFRHGGRLQRMGRGDQKFTEWKEISI